MTTPHAQAPDPTTAARGVVVPDRPALEGLEAKWAEHWKADDTYRFDRTQPRANVYSIDTPPPTVSGSLHVGHVFSYTHTDLIARFQAERSGLRAVLSTGYGTELDPHRLGRLRHVRLLPKPFAPDAVVRFVRECLADR